VDSQSPAQDPSRFSASCLRSTFAADRQPTMWNTINQGLILPGRAGLGSPRVQRSDE
jgi:hypothetical protein